jgi:hypothetical protein
MEDGSAEAGAVCSVLPTQIREFCAEKVARRLEHAARIPGARRPPTTSPPLFPSL